MRPTHMGDGKPQFVDALVVERCPTEVQDHLGNTAVGDGVLGRIVLPEGTTVDQLTDVLIDAVFQLLGESLRDGLVERRRPGIGRDPRGGGDLLEVHERHDRHFRRQ